MALKVQGLSVAALALKLYMKPLTKKFLVLLVALAVAPIGLAFSLLGPYSRGRWQLWGTMCPGMGISAGRWISTRVIAGTCHGDLRVRLHVCHFFWEQRIAAVEKAIQILNDLPPAASITNDGRIALFRGQRVLSIPE